MPYYPYIDPDVVFETLIRHGFAMWPPTEEWPRGYPKLPQANKSATPDSTARWVFHWLEENHRQVPYWLERKVMEELAGDPELVHSP